MTAAGGGRRAANDEAEFRRRMEDALGQAKLSDIIGQYTTLKPAGRELVGLCMFHSERSPSLRVSDSKGRYHCFGCGAGGDAIGFLVAHCGLSFMDALRDLEGGTYPEADPAARARAAAEDDAERAAAIAEAAAIWDRAIPATGTPAEVYARSRGITMPLPPSIRFVETYAWRDKETGEFGSDLPALVGAVTDGAGELIGIQRIFLRTGGNAKARMKKPKLSLGRIVGGALKLDRDVARDVPEHPLLSPDSNLAEIIITEGPEDGLSLAQEMPDRRVWVALGTAMMPMIEYPHEVRSIVIAGQNDDAGRAAVHKARAGLLDRGYAVSLMWPAPAFKDWNDQLRGIRA